MLVGAHVSAGGGLYKSVENALDIGANCFAMFVRSQRRWTSPPLLEGDIQKFTTALRASRIKPEHVIVHGSYLTNLANPDPEKLEQSYQAMADEMGRCERLGLCMYNIHPGSAVDNTPIDSAIRSIADCINRAHRDIPRVTVLIETMAGQGHTIGSSFEEIRSIIDLVECKERIGVCLDTCHIFAAGYDIRCEKTYRDTMLQFDQTIGLDKLHAVHLNDSKGDLGCRADRHENIGKGRIGVEGFRSLVSDARMQGIPMVLETPDSSPGIYKREIDLLRSLF